jgi:hypothetical protein
MWLVPFALLFGSCLSGQLDSIYKLNRLSPINIEEITSPRCRSQFQIKYSTSWTEYLGIGFVAGGVFVNSAARQYIVQKLKGSKWDDPLTIESAVRKFDQVKRPCKSQF